MCERLSVFGQRSTCCMYLFWPEHLDSEPNLSLNSRGFGLAMYIKLELGAVHGTKRSCPTLTIHHKQA